MTISFRKGKPILVFPDLVQFMEYQRKVIERLARKKHVDPDTHAQEVYVPKFAAEFREKHIIGGAV